MCEVCFGKCSPEGSFPEELKRRYVRRNWRTTSSDEADGVIEHLFFIQEKYPEDEYWKGVERIRFNDHPYPLQYRFGYWANRGKGWEWGESSPYVPQHIANAIFARMMAEGWISSQ
jgi:hypothetical protein